jgi:hypothetical protein
MALHPKPLLNCHPAVMRLSCFRGRLALVTTANHAVRFPRIRIEMSQHDEAQRWRGWPPTANPNGRTLLSTDACIGWRGEETPRHQNLNQPGFFLMRLRQQHRQKRAHTQPGLSVTQL